MANRCRCTLPLVLNVRGRHLVRRNDPEPCLLRILAEHFQAIDDDMLDNLVRAGLLAKALRKREGRIEEPGQGHVKGELLEDVGIAIAFEVMALARCELLRAPPFALGKTERCSERLKSFDDGSLQLRERLG